MTLRSVVTAAAAGALVLAGCGTFPTGDGDVRVAAGPSETSATPSPAPSPTPTEPPPEVLLRFAVIGDFGTGDSNQQAVADRMCAYREGHPYRFVFTTGDNIYPDGDPARFDDAFFEPYSCLLSDGVGFHASIGNHDFLTDEAQPEIDEPAFGMKAANYVVRKNGVRFVIASAYPLNRDWLRTKLTAKEGDVWTVAIFHPPVFSPGLHGSTPGYGDLPGMFARKGVDLVLNGHDHLYSATRKLRKIRYVLTGGGGAPLYDCSDKWFVAKCSSRHHFLYVVAKGDRIVVRAVPTSGAVLHRFETTGR